MADAGVKAGLESRSSSVSRSSLGQGISLREQNVLIRPAAQHIRQTGKLGCHEPLEPTHEAGFRAELLLKGDPHPGGYSLSHPEGGGA